ncbi:MAG: ABC transporter permease, partial [Planctomycetota bacterium]
MALSTSLVAAIACALASLNAGMEYRLASTIGTADLQVREVVGERFDEALLEIVRATEGVEKVSPRSREPISIRVRDGDQPMLASVQGVDPELEASIVQFEPDIGRALQNNDEIILDRTSADELGIDVGDAVIIGKPGGLRTVEVVGIVLPKTIEIVDKPGGYLTLGALRQATGLTGRLHEIQIVCADGADLDAIIASLTESLPSNILVRKTERITSGIDSRVRINELFFLLATILSYIASGFIVLTGL